MIAGLLLAAGRSRRFGGDKLVALWRGRAIVRWSAEALRQVVDRLVVVVPSGADAIREALRGLDVEFVENAAPERGISSSIMVGAGAALVEADAVLIALADEPGLDPAIARQVIARYRRGDAAIVTPAFRGVPGHPVLFDRRVAAELGALDGDRGARAVVDRDPARVAIVAIDATPWPDIDTREDLARLDRDAQFSAPHDHNDQ